MQGRALRRQWPRAPQRPTLAGREVHVWRADLRLGEAALRELRASLSEEERGRADRFHFPEDRDHFVAARGALRDILGRYTGVAPRLLRFSYDCHGKPALCGDDGGSLRFNVSHSRGLALYAFARGREVGIDVEFVREDLAGLEVAERFFSGREVAALRALPPCERAAAFFDCWTRKEAYVKARGEGLSHPLRLFTVSLAPGEPARLLHTDGDPREAARWSLVGLSPGGGYRAALAAEGGPVSLRCWQWP